MSSIGLGLGSEVLHQGVKDAQAGSGVDGLSEEASGETSVQVHSLAAGDDLSSDRQGGGLGASCRSLAGELDADLDHVDGLNDRSGHHTADATIDKRQGGPHDGRVK